MTLTIKKQLVSRWHGRVAPNGKVTVHIPQHGRTVHRYVPTHRQCTNPKLVIENRARHIFEGTGRSVRLCVTAQLKRADPQQRNIIQQRRILRDQLRRILGNRVSIRTIRYHLIECRGGEPQQVHVNRDAAQVGRRGWSRTVCTHLSIAEIDGVIPRNVRQPITTAGSKLCIARGQAEGIVARSTIQFITGRTIVERIISRGIVIVSTVAEQIIVAPKRQTERDPD